MSIEAVTLLCALFAAHFMGDFTPLASERMLEAKASGTPVLPIALHALVHAVLVAIAVLLFATTSPAIVGTAVLIEFGTHFVLDWSKGRLAARRPSTSDPANRQYWVAFGMDQLAHAIVLVIIAYVVIDAAA